MPRFDQQKGSKPAVSVVVIALNEGEHLRLTVENLLDTLPAKSEILVVDDGSEDGSTAFLARARKRVRLVSSDHLGVAKARNWGALQTGGDYVVFADAHITLEKGWLPPLLGALNRPGVGAAAPAIYDVAASANVGFGLVLTGPELDADWLPRQGERPYAVPILPGCCLAMKREIFTATGGFDDGLLSRGGVDNELGVRLWLQGYELVLVPSVSVGHVFRKKSPYPVQWSTYLHNRIRLAMLHFGPQRLEKVKLALGGHNAYTSAMALVRRGNARLRRIQLERSRARNDDWFFERFGLEW
jgi:GT2 family glycosyltransferase